jgi:hypothetical protein
LAYTVSVAKKGDSDAPFSPSNTVPAVGAEKSRVIHGEALPVPGQGMAVVPNTLHATGATRGWGWSD